MEGAFVITWKELLVAAIVVLGVYIAELLLLMHSGRGRRGTQARELAELRRELAEMKNRLDRLETAKAAEAEEEGTTPYARAFRLARQGMGVAEVAAACGISRAEAELIVAMQRSSQA